MAILIPFKGIVYNQKKIKNIAKVVTPPYDVISPGAQEEFYKAHPYNIIRLILGWEFPSDNKKNNKYKRAAKFFKSWQRSGVLLQDKQPSMYVYLQEYKNDGKKYQRCGFLSLLKFETEKKSVLPHERVIPKPRLDRFKLLKEVHANLSPIFSIFADSSGEVDKILRSYIKNAKPFINIMFEGVRNKFWRIDDQLIQDKIIEKMQNKRVFIADGHHRYESAMDFCNCMRKKNPKHTGRENYNFVMMYFVSSEDKGLTILPTHRAVKEIPIKDVEYIERRLKDYFHLKSFSSRKQMLKNMDHMKDRIGVFGMFLGGRRYFLLVLKDQKCLDRVMNKEMSKQWRRLDVAILHDLILGHILKTKQGNNILYVKDAGLVSSLVEEGKYKAGFFLNPTKISQVKTVATLGERMPPKSTYFYPKLLTGLVLSKLD